MHTSERARRAAALQKVGHFLTALVVILKGVVKLEHPEGYWPLIVFLFAGGAYIAVVTVLHDRLHHHMRRIEASVYAIESLVMVAMTWIFVSEGKNAIQYVTGLAALAFAVATMVRLIGKRESHRAGSEAASSSPVAPVAPVAPIVPAPLDPPVAAAVSCPAAATPADPAEGADEAGNGVEAPAVSRP